MHRIVTGSFDDFAGAARGVSALMADGFGHGEISIVAVPPPPLERARPERLRTGALIAGALGAMIGPGSVWAWTADPGAMLMWAPSLGALAGALLGAVGAVVLERRAQRLATRHTPGGEIVSVLVDSSRAARVESILKQQGATLGRRPRTSRVAHAPPRAARPAAPTLVPYRP